MGEVKRRNYYGNLIFMDGKNLVFIVIQFRRLEVSVKSARMSCSHKVIFIERFIFVFQFLKF